MTVRVGGVLGLRQIAQQFPSKAEFIIVTVGLADVQDAENIRNIRSQVSFVDDAALNTLRDTLLGRKSL